MFKINCHFFCNRRWHFIKMKSYLKFVSFSHKKNSRKFSLYKCLLCGKEKVISDSKVNCLQIRSCGCLTKKHGMCKTRFYKLWGKMITRCFNKNHKHYKHYGGRGISVCKEWRNFINFKSDMYDLYLNHCKDFGIKETTLDRIDVNKNYYKENCRWEDMLMQKRNRRNAILYNNKYLSQLSKEKNISYSTLLYRLKHDFPENLLFCTNRINKNRKILSDKNHQLTSALLKERC